MKKIKRILAMIMAFVMIMGMSTMAFAEGETTDGGEGGSTQAPTATITVTGLPAAVAEAEGVEKVEVGVKYLQVVIPDRNNVTGWQFVDENIAKIFRDAFKVKLNDSAILKLIELGKLEDVNHYAESGLANEENGGTVSASDFAAAIAQITTSESATAPTGDSTDWTITATEAGLYVINATATDYTYIPMAVYVGYADGEEDFVDATVKAKGSENKIEKDIVNKDSADNDKSVTAGDIVEFTATTQYPFYGANIEEEQTTFTITDTITAGAATYVADTVEVKIGGVPATVNEDYTITEYAGLKTFTITFDYDATKAGKTVIVTYSVLVGEEDPRLGNDIVNKITTNFDEDGDTVTIDKVTVKVIKTDVDKNAAGEVIYLDGATFKIYEAVTAAAEGFVETPNVAVVETPGAEPVKGQTLYLKAIDTQVTAGEKGEATFVGLDAHKTYYIKETEAPVGYSLNENYYKLTAPTETTATGSKTYTYNNFADTTITDTKLLALPSTGGIGTTIFTVAGCAIMIAAAGFFFASRKKEEE